MLSASLMALFVFRQADGKISVSISKRYTVGMLKVSEFWLWAFNKQGIALKMIQKVKIVCINPDFFRYC